MAQYRKKPVVIDAIQFTQYNDKEVKDFCSKIVYIDSLNAFIKTLEGNMIVSDGDFIIKGVEGEFYPCKPAIFAKTYDLVNQIHIPHN